jgi:hypothetical protein
MAHEPRRRVDHGGFSDVEEYVTGGRIRPALNVASIERLAEPNDRRARIPAAMGAARNRVGQRYAVIAPWRYAVCAAVEALHLPQRAVQANDVARARTDVQVIDVLRDDPNAGDIALRPACEDVMRGVWLA